MAERKNPCELPDDYRLGIYADPDKGTLNTVDVHWSKNEILMHDETNDVPFVITPHALRKKLIRVGVKKWDGHVLKFVFTNGMTMSGSIVGLTYMDYKTFRVG